MDALTITESSSWLTGTNGSTMDLQLPALKILLSIPIFSKTAEKPKLCEMTPMLPTTELLKKRGEIVIYRSKM